MRLFYDSNINSKDTSHQLSEEESKHIIRVLRMNIGDTVGLLNGNGSLFECQISEDNPNRCKLIIIEEKIEDRPSYDILIAIGPT